MVEPFEYRDTVRDEWIDYNGHLSEPYYVLVFGDATTAMMDATGMDAAYRERTGSSLYTVEAHVRYLREVAPGTALLVRTSVLAAEARKLRFHHEMYDSETLVATERLLSVHVTGGRATPFPAGIFDRLKALEVSPPAGPR